MRIAWFSPFQPQQSGISDYSEELLPELAKHADVEVFFDGRPQNPEIARRFVQHPVSAVDDRTVREGFDALVYQVGNHSQYHRAIADALLRHPGVLELHDVSLHNLMADATYVRGDTKGYLAGIRASHGAYGARIAQRFLDGHAPPPWATHPLELTVNRPLVERATAAIVHSDLARQMVKALNPRIPVLLLPLHAVEIVDDPVALRADCRRRLGLPADRLLFGSFGFATQEKRIPQILAALARFRKTDDADFTYCILGKPLDLDLPALAAEHGLTDHVAAPGFVSPATFRNWMGACDACLNLRHPTRGESSATLHRMLGLGRLVLVSDGGAFDEVPDDLVVRIRHDDREEQDLLSAFRRIRDGGIDLPTVGRKAVRFARKHCDLAVNARRLAAFLAQAADGTFADDPVERSLDRLFDLGLVDDAYVRHCARAVEILVPKKGSPA